MQRGWMAGLWCALLIGLMNAGTVRAQTSRPAEAPPAVVDSYRDVPISAGRTGGATTRAAGVASKPSDPLDARRVGIALLVVLAAIYGAHRIWRRMGMPGAANKSGQTLQVVSRLAVSPRQQVLLIRVGRRFVLVGNSGTQMNPLCEIDDPEEAAALLGQTVTESKESVTATFNDVLDGAQQQYNVDVAPPSARGDEEQVDTALEETRTELGEMMDKVRMMSKQFQGEAR